MGDMAEYAIQQGMDEWMYEGDFDICYRRGKVSRSCGRCSAPGLEWRRFEKKWRLFNSAGKLHVCPNPVAKDAFK